MEPFPEDIARVIDDAWRDAPKWLELDAEGRYVRGVYEGMTPEEVDGQRRAYEAGDWSGFIDKLKKADQ